MRGGEERGTPGAPVSELNSDRWILDQGLVRFKRRLGGSRLALRPAENSSTNWHMESPLPAVGRAESVL